MAFLPFRFFILALAAVACVARLRNDASALALQEGENPGKTKSRTGSFYTPDDMAKEKRHTCNALRSGCTWLALPCCAACVCTDKTYTKCTTVRTTCKGKWKSVLSMAVTGKGRCDYLYSFDAAKYPVYYDEEKAQSLNMVTASKNGMCSDSTKDDPDGK